MNKNELKKKLGQRIIELREKQGWSQAAMARTCRKDRQTIEKIENGKVNPTLYTLQEIAEGLSVTLQDLVRF